MMEKKNFYNENLSDTFFWFNPIPMWIYARSNKRILEVNNAAINAYGYSKIQFRYLFHDDFIGEDIPTDFQDDLEPELRKHLFIPRTSDGSSFVTLMVESPVIYNKKEAMLARSIKVFN
ncbi:hypothetical protein LQ318_05720 [Aliifodinibius salicampi]|uniref:PAS domain S-box-containing protein n=1 Tax=Fodinibius salicampi TaxID=1920655 RepID=A0ABT3PX31_9BACT|nr:hypothetical protein [Fodinibius salicampi]MCW9712400.1 hypothetical protein [Fodinibius salicampi]